ncbi:MAG: hypothetical protein F6K48_31400 [Okeania sp. SIO3H1]|uniref:hypothetical protein n=1 Tax=Okeania sp. SIO1I7 TaxID=2607772 RepID=UPI0013C90DC5|nr:hypothetical protein [Okeania sp. SIO1I7]NEN93151.1 hypothetical protein [Okeania sp. SIO3H1]NET26222.1 hypothetical protein [Okeania sp. SIO1I7]
MVQWIFFSNIKQLPISCEKLADYLLIEGGVVLLRGIADGKFRVVKFSGKVNIEDMNCGKPLVALKIFPKYEITADKL